MSQNNKNNNYLRDEQIEKRKRHKKMMLRKKQMRKRRITFFVLVIIILTIIVKLFTTFISNRASTKEISYETTLPVWYLEQIFRQNNGQPDHSKATYYNESEKMLAAFDKATGIKKSIMKGSNHLVSADEYAYDTKDIRSYIRGEKEYKGKDKLVFLTFDDGPNNIITPQVLETLSKNDVHATFFVVGKNIVEDHYDILKKTVMDGNSLGIHSFSHDYTKLYPGRKADENQVIEEARLAEGRMQKVFGKNFSCNVWRYPGGHMSWENVHSSDALLNKDNFEWIDWNCLVGDAERKAVRPTNTQEQINYLSKSLHQNLHSEVAVVLMHDAANKQLTADSLQSVIDYFKENNYKFGILK